MQKCICVTGTSGFIGPNVVADLLKMGYKVKALVKNMPAGNREIEDVEYFEIDQLELAFRDADTLLHLAARNNDSDSTAEEFDKDNFELTKDLALAANAFGVQKFIFVSTTRAINPKHDDFYSVSKAKAEAWLTNSFSGDMQICIARLPPVHGPKTKNKLANLEKLPRLVKIFLLTQLRALTPIVSVIEVSSNLCKLIEKAALPREVMISSPLTRSSSYWGFFLLTNACFILLSLIMLPLLIAIAVAISITSKGPILFLQMRVGKHKTPYTCIKFRTMALGTKQQGTHLVSASSITRIGSFLRKTKLDEFPQAINILTGRMSLIGPRPCLPIQQDVVQERDILGVYKLTPGISGLAQVHDVDMSTPKKLAVYDQRYYASRSILVDCKIALQTATGRGQGDLVK